MLTIKDIRDIQATGASVYMKPDEKCTTWAVCERGQALAYVERPRTPFTGASVSTIHKPNRFCGTGFKVATDLAEFTPEAMDEGFSFAPDWAFARDRESVRKYDGMFEYRSANTWNREYRRLPEAVLLAHAADDLFLYTVNDSSLYGVIKEKFRRIAADKKIGRYAPGAWLAHAKRGAASYEVEIGADHHTALFHIPMVAKAAAEMIAAHYEEEVAEHA